MADWLSTLGIALSAQYPTATGAKKASTGDKVKTNSNSKMSDVTYQNPSASNGNLSNYDGYPYSYGYGGGSSGPSQEYKDNLFKVSAANAQAALQQYNDEMKSLDNASAQNLDFLNVNKKQNVSKSASDWYTQQKKLQSTTDYLSDAFSKMKYGSASQDFNDLLRREDDFIDVASLQSLKENNLNAENEYNQTEAQITNSRNSGWIDTIKAIKDIIIDNSAQLNASDESAASNLFDGTNINFDNSDLKKYYGNDIIEFIKNGFTPTQYDHVYNNSMSREDNSLENVMKLTANNRNNSSTIYQNSIKGYDRRN